MQVPRSDPLWAGIVIWSIQYQDRISHYFRLFMLAAAMMVTFLGVLGAVPLSSALWSLFFGGLLVIGVVWYLIQKRKTWLLNIEDPDLKRLAYETMLTYIILKKNCLRQANPENKECMQLRNLMASRNV